MIENPHIAQTGKIISVGSDGSPRVDYLYRISFKALIYNDAGRFRWSKILAPKLDNLDIVCYYLLEG